MSSWYFGFNLWLNPSVTCINQHLQAACFIFHSLLRGWLFLKMARDTKSGQHKYWCPSVNHFTQYHLHIGLCLLFIVKRLTGATFPYAMNTKRPYSCHGNMGNSWPSRFWKKCLHSGWAGQVILSSVLWCHLIYLTMLQYVLVQFLVPGPSCASYPPFPF